MREQQLRKVFLSVARDD